MIPMALTAHAYVVAGNADIIPSVCALLEEWGIVVRGNADVFTRAYTTFSMDDARSIRERAALRAMAGRRVFVIAAPTIAPDAQNALLKTFEEPSADTLFILIVPSPDMLLPTLRSRMQTLALENASHLGVELPSQGTVVDAMVFLASTPEKRMDMLKPLLDKDEDDRRDLAGAIIFLSALEKALAKNPTEHAQGLRAVYRARKYCTDRGALTKTLLEQAALLIPKML